MPVTGAPLPNKLMVDPSRCIGSGNCVLVDDTIFSQDREDGTVELLTDEVSPEREGVVTLALDACPVGAIWWHTPDDHG